jgi:FMN phosphatase YigB (HAD superfamily)
MSVPSAAVEPVVFLLDVDNTLLDNDRVIDDLRSHLTREIGAECQERYWSILGEIREELGYTDYLGALQRYRLENPRDVRVLEAASFLLRYPFAERLYPGALDVVAHLERWGTPVILTDGDVVLQPWKVERSGLRAAVGGRVLVYVHKERQLADVERRYPASHYVFIDDKVRLLTAFKEAWGARVTTILPLQGHYAHDPRVASYPGPDSTIDRIADLLAHDPPPGVRAKNP